MNKYPKVLQKKSYFQQQLLFHISLLQKHRERLEHKRANGMSFALF